MDFYITTVAASSESTTSSTSKDVTTDGVGGLYSETATKATAKGNYEDDYETDCYWTLLKTSTMAVTTEGPSIETSISEAFHDSYYGTTTTTISTSSYDERRRAATSTRTFSSTERF